MKRLEQGPAIERLGLGSRKGVGLFAYAVTVFIPASVVAVVVSDAGIPDIEALVLIGIDVVSVEVVAEDEIVSVLIEPYAMPIVRGVIAVDGIVLAAPGELQAVEIAFGSVPGQQVIAAVLLQADAYAKAGHNIAAAVVFGHIVCDIVVVGAVRDQDPIFVVICAVCSHLTVGGSPKGQAKGVLGDKVTGYVSLLRLLEKDAPVGVANHAIIINLYIRRALNIQAVFPAVGQTTGSYKYLAALKYGCPNIAAIHGCILEGKPPYILRR
jgi:hypothetical protein